MHTLITIVHVIACVFMILVVLLQSGRGGGVGAAFAGASGQIFGGRGASSFLSRATSVAATVFFLTSLTLSVLDSRHGSVVRGMQAKPEKEAAGDPNDQGDTDKTATDKASDKGDKADQADTDKAEGSETGTKPGTDAPGEGAKPVEGTKITPAAPDKSGSGDAEKPGKPEAVPPGAPEKP